MGLEPINDLCLSTITLVYKKTNLILILYININFVYPNKSLIKILDSTSSRPDLENGTCGGGDGGWFNIFGDKLLEFLYTFFFLFPIKLHKIHIIVSLHEYFQSQIIIRACKLIKFFYFNFHNSDGTLKQWINSQTTCKCAI